MPAGRLEEGSESDEESPSTDDDKDVGKRPPPLRCRRRTVALASCCCVLTLALVIAIQVVSYRMMALEWVKTRDDWAPSLSTTPADALEMFEHDHAETWVCERAFYTFGDTATHAKKWYTENGWINVSFPSRHKKSVPDITLTAFYFKSKIPNSPTIIVQHGNNVNNRDHTVMTAAYFLSSMGYNVLTANLRNHGDSGTTPNDRITWAAQEAYDVLGAWDYVVSDPDGKLGGPQLANRTALYGFSMGGLICRVAFAIEKRIPALLTDSAVWNAREVLEYHINLIVPGFGWFFIPSAWFWAKRITGENLDKLIPEKELKAVGDFRYISAVHATDDTTVQFQQSEAFHKFVAKSDYMVPVEWYEEVNAQEENSACGTHCTMHLRWPLKYRHFLCEFFGYVFDEPHEECRDTRLQHPAAAGVGKEITVGPSGSYSDSNPAPG